MNKTIVFFDFDGTITTKDSLLDFIKYYHGNIKLTLGLFFLTPILLLYKMNIISNYKAKEILLRYFFEGVYVNTFKNIAREYSLNKIDEILNTDAIKKLNWHKELNHEIIVVSASIECWIQDWCTKNNIKLISTKLEIINFKLTGKLKGKNCYGIEKVNKINCEYNLKVYDNIYVYGDSNGDKEMLALASKGKGFFKCF